MIERSLNIPWETTVRVNYLREGMIDEEFIKNLKNPVVIFYLLEQNQVALEF